MIEFRSPGDEQVSECQIINATDRFQENISMDQFATQEYSEPGIVLSFFAQTRSRRAWSKKQYMLAEISMERFSARTGIKPPHGGQSV